MAPQVSHATALKWLSGAFIAAWACSLLYLYLGDSQIGFLNRRIEIQDRWAAHFPNPALPRIIITGGSSCTFSIDAERMTSQSGTPVINAGLEAGMGPAGILLYSSRLALPGDTFVIAIEPDGLTDPPQFSKDTLRLILFRHDWNLVRQSHEIVDQSVPLPSLIFSGRPGLDGFAASIGRWVMRTPFRYDNAQVNASSFMTTSFRTTLATGLHLPAITPNNRALLIHFRDWAAKKQIHVIYSLPWCYVSDDLLVAQRQANARFLLALSEILPILHDETLGAQSHADMFSDTSWHLNGPTAEVRSAMILGEIQNQAYWTHDELLASMQTPNSQSPIEPNK